MFLLKDLPTEATAARFEREFRFHADPAATLGFLNILRTGSDLVQALDSFLERYGLRHGRWITMVLLMRRSDFTALPSELAEEQGVRKATISGLLDSLERDGFVSRLGDEKDRRRAPVRLTSKGKKLMMQIMPEYYRRISALMSEIPANRLRQLASDMHRVSSNVNTFIVMNSDEKPKP